MPADPSTAALAKARLAIGGPGAFRDILTKDLTRAGICRTVGVAVGPAARPASSVRKTGSLVYWAIPSPTANGR